MGGGGAELSDAVAIDACKVSAANNVIDIDCRHTMVVNVKTPNGDIVNHEVDTKDTVVVVKKKHSDKIGVK